MSKFFKCVENSNSISLTLRERTMFSHGASLGKPVRSPTSFVLFVLLTFTAASQGGEPPEPDYQSLASQLIRKDNSLSSVDLYEIHQVVIIQRHVDKLSVDEFRVFLHFAVRAVCKDVAENCSNQTRHCRASFSLEKKQVKDDVTECQPLPELFGPRSREGVSTDSHHGLTKIPENAFGGVIANFGDKNSGPANFADKNSGPANFGDKNNGPCGNVANGIGKSQQDSVNDIGIPRNLQ